MVFTELHTGGKFDNKNYKHLEDFMELEQQ